MSHGTSLTIELWEFCTLINTFVVEEWGTKDWSCPRSQQVPWDSHQMRALGFAQKIIQEWALVKWKQVYLERSIDRMSCLRRWGWPLGAGVVSFSGWGSFMGYKEKEYSNYLGDRTGISRNWGIAPFLPFFGLCLRTVMVPVGMSLKMLMYYNALIMRLKVHRKSNLLPSWVWWVLTSFCYVPEGHVILLIVVPCPLPSCLNYIIYYCLLLMI